MHIVDQYGKRIDVKRIEAKEQQLAKKYIKNDDVVLELGARYGSVSVTIYKCVIISPFIKKVCITFLSKEFTFK